MIVPRADLAHDAVGHHYDELDAFYREVWGEHVHHGFFVQGKASVAEATEALIEQLADAAQIAAGDRVCDVGCGYGGTARWLARHRGAHVAGLTLSEAQAAYAREQPLPEGAPVPEILVRDWLANGLPDDAFDAVLAIESTTHMPERPRVFAEMARVLKPGGRLTACIWMARENPRAWEVRHLLEPICREGRLHGMGTAAENRAWLEAAGLVIEHEADWSAQVAKTWTICIRRVAAGLIRKPEWRQFLRDARRRDRVFTATLLRIRLAYATGAMRYGFIVARKP
ncbi:MAG: methyltransferase domain-containing protein [Rhodothermaceae bacterium]|nr:methyltransferase domain-containing protein [Rhodothermaceae bacterium]